MIVRVDKDILLRITYRGRTYEIKETDLDENHGISLRLCDVEDGEILEEISFDSFDWNAEKYPLEKDCFHSRIEDIEDEDLRELLIASGYFEDIGDNSFNGIDTMPIWRFKK